MAEQSDMEYSIRTIIYNDSLRVDLLESDVKALHSFSAETVIEILHDIFEKEDDDVIKSRAYGQILSFREFDAVKFLLDMYDKSTIGWQIAYCRSLSLFNDARAISALGKIILEGGDPDIRFVAAESLAEIGDESVLDALEYVRKNDTGLDYEGFSVADAAYNAILKIKNRIEKI